MKPLSSLSGCARRKPRQARGEHRVASLLAAAVEEFAAVGYEAATMCSIAERAGSPIGSLYQFFPNKESVARAVRTAQIEDVERCWLDMQPLAATGSLSPFVDRFVEVMVEFADQHPAFLPLLDAPSSTLPVGPRHRLRKQLVTLLHLVLPRLSSSRADRVAEVVMQVNRAMLGLYARSARQDRAWVVKEYRAITGDCLQRNIPACRPDVESTAGVRSETGKPRRRGVATREAHAD